MTVSQSKTVRSALSSATVMVERIIRKNQSEDGQELVSLYTDWLSEIVAAKKIMVAMRCDEDCHCDACEQQAREEMESALSYRGQTTDEAMDEMLTGANEKRTAQDHVLSKM